MRQFRNIFLALAGAILLAMTASCSKAKDIKITSVAVDSFSPKGFRAADAVLAIGIDNPTFSFTLTNLSGVVKYNGEDFATYSADSLTVDKKCSKVYDLPCSAMLSENVKLSQVVSLLQKKSLEGFTTDVEAHVKLKNGLGKTLKFTDLDLQKMTEK